MRTKIWLARVGAHHGVRGRMQRTDRRRDLERRVRDIVALVASPSRSISLPSRSDEVATPSEEPSEAPTEAPTEEPTEAPTEEPTEAPDRRADGSPDGGADRGAHGGADGSADRGAHDRVADTERVRGRGTRGRRFERNVRDDLVGARPPGARGSRGVAVHAQPSSVGHVAGGVRRDRRRPRPVGAGGLGAVRGSRCRRGVDRSGRPEAPRGADRRGRSGGTRGGGSHALRARRRTRSARPARRERRKCPRERIGHRGAVAAFARGAGRRARRAPHRGRREWRIDDGLRGMI